MNSLSNRDKEIKKQEEKKKQEELEKKKVEIEQKEIDDFTNLITKSYDALIMKQSIENYGNVQKLKELEEMVTSLSSSYIPLTLKIEGIATNEQKLQLKKNYEELNDKQNFANFLLFIQLLFHALVNNCSEDL